MLIHPLTGYNPKPNRAHISDLHLCYPHQVFVFVSVVKTNLRYHKPLNPE